MGKNLCLMFLFCFVLFVFMIIIIIDIYGLTPKFNKHLFVIKSANCDDRFSRPTGKLTKSSRTEQ